MCFLVIDSTGVSTALSSHRFSTVLQCCSMYGTKEKFHVLKGGKNPCNGSRIDDYLKDYRSLFPSVLMFNDGILRI